MINTISLKEFAKVEILEMRPPITYDHTRDIKSRKNVRLNELANNPMVICLGGNGLNPFGHIIHCHQDVKISNRIREWAHKVNSPYVEDIDNEDWLHGHLIPLRNATHLLAS
ncbi:hypothetical protein HanXRQr2_Chr08g0337741 [Helianthus annuus]|uniref:Uncharacterized protein n=1 Tax=Helianthus annuus TaxID=4232 RepID=A0A9K3NCK6_HELAN|nr:hypothetical protein HanXRQr2_Chr08g0337741 [Helianthus annuus]KAJ0901511.1 hypothetical protein HanPSC8_Chr08g0326161 [Helianthus annuus]